MINKNEEEIKKNELAINHCHSGITTYIIGLIRINRQIIFINRG